MSDTLPTPALAPVQWSTLSHRDTLSGEIENACGELDLWPSPEYGFTVTRHALAALALHEQPFGFTHEDLAAMETVYRFALSAPGRLPERVSNAIERHYVIAAKVAALLPPIPEPS